MQTPGTYISAVGHVGLIGWLILGWGLSSDPLPFEVSELSVVSTAEFDAMVAASTPNPNVDEPTEPIAPVVEEPPALPVAETPPEVQTPPAPSEPPVAETPPPTPPTPPAPPEEVADVAPVQPTPPAEPDAPSDVRPTPRPVPRIAPTPVAPPPPDADVADVAQDAVVPDETANAEVETPVEDATAPQEAASEIAIADETPSGAVTTSLRPLTRPSRPAPAPQTPAQTTTASSDNASDAAVEAALAAAIESTASPNLPAGPPMTGSEKEGFRVAVNACWNVDPGSQAARVTLTVGFRLTQAGKVDGDVRQISANGGDDSATNIAFQSARRAILRCGASGYDLPADKYDQWRDVEITFDPSGMRMR